MMLRLLPSPSRLRDAFDLIAKLAALVLEHLELHLAAVKVARLECD